MQLLCTVSIFVVVFTSITVTEEFTLIMNETTPISITESTPIAGEGTTSSTSQSTSTVEQSTTASTTQFASTMASGVTTSTTQATSAIEESTTASTTQVASTIEESTTASSTQVASTTASGVTTLTTQVVSTIEERVTASTPQVASTTASGVTTLTAQVASTIEESTTASATQFTLITMSNTAVSTGDSTTITFTSSTPSTTTTYLQPPHLLFECSFANKTCLATGLEYVTITNGSQFAIDIRNNSREPPRGPLSAATSVSKTTSGNEACKIPYNISFFTNTSANWDMWFCFEDKCPSASCNVLNCSSGNYALIPYTPGQPYKDISMSVMSKSRNAAVVPEQCLFYYYYMTVYNDSSDRNQTIQVYIENNNPPVNRTLIDTVTIANMANDNWQNHTVDINWSTGDYSLVFSFELDNNTSTDSALDKPIYFALDDIKLYDANCSYAERFFNTDTTTTTTLSTSTTTTSTLASEPDIGLIVALTLGLGIPFLFGVIVGIVYCSKTFRRGHTDLRKGSNFDILRTYPTEQYNDSDNIVSTVF